MSRAWERRVGHSFIMVAVGLAVTVTGCGGAKAPATEDLIGTPCIPAAEKNPGYSGTAPGEINIDRGGAPCGETLFCLSLWFTGRVSCPNGQTREALTLPDNDPSRCLTPKGEAVEVVVEPNNPLTPASTHVICSCDCGAEAPNRCTCPADMECSDIGLSVTDPSNGIVYTGNYCVHPGTRDPRR